jgi:hypothetical protein
MFAKGGSIINMSSIQGIVSQTSVESVSLTLYQASARETAKGGSIINMSSIQGIVSQTSVGSVSLTLYQASARETGSNKNSVIPVIKGIKMVIRWL